MAYGVDYGFKDFTGRAFSPSSDGMTTGVYTADQAAADAAARARYPDLYAQQQAMANQQNARFRQFFGNNPSTGTSAPIPPGFFGGQTPSSGGSMPGPRMGGDTLNQLPQPTMPGRQPFNPMMGGLGGFGGFGGNMNPFGGGFGGIAGLLAGLLGGGYGGGFGGYGGGFNPMMGGYGGFNPGFGFNPQPSAPWSQPMNPADRGMGRSGSMGGYRGGFGGGSFQAPQPQQGGFALQSDPYGFRGTQANQFVSGNNMATTGSAMLGNRPWPQTNLPVGGSSTPPASSGGGGFGSTFGSGVTFDGSGGGGFGMAAGGLASLMKRK